MHFKLGCGGYLPCAEIFKFILEDNTFCNRNTIFCNFRTTRQTLSPGQGEGELPSERLFNDDIASFWSECHGDGGSEDVDSLEQSSSSFDPEL
jgi:hypothetical protein